jgi:hypothetical protein
MMGSKRGHDMLFKRRDFIKTTGVASAVALLSSHNKVFGKSKAAPYFSIHDFILNHPEAVFIKKTNISDALDSDAKKTTGYNLAREIFVPALNQGFPTTNPIAIKPNLTASSCIGGAVNTDPFFVEGIIECLKEFGASQISMVEINGADQWQAKGYTDMALRTGTTLRDLYTDPHNLSIPDQISWVNCPNGVVLRKIPYQAPVNQPGSWLLNISKLKAHSMGITACCKNLQGTVGYEYCTFCARSSSITYYQRRQPEIWANFNPNFLAEIQTLYNNHIGSIPRWDKPSPTANVIGGDVMELWAQRTCDSLSVTTSGFHMIEGILSQDGDGFCAGSDGGSPLLVPSNVIIFGMDKFKVDIIGHWMGNHEPGNFGFFHIAKERGLTNTVNPADIPVYMWDAAGPTLAPLSSLERFPLKTTYLKRDYNGQTEDTYHFVNEPYNYSSLLPNPYKQPEIFTLDQVNSKSYHNLVQLEYRIPRSANVLLEIFNVHGQREAVLVDGWRQNGAHLASWKVAKQPSGLYFFRLVADGHRQNGKISLVR